MGFYSSFALEQLSSIDYIMQHNGATTPDQVQELLMTWNQRKRTLFSNPRFVELAVERLQNSITM